MEEYGKARKASQPARPGTGPGTDLLLAAQRTARMGEWSHDLAAGTVECSSATCDLFGLIAHGGPEPGERFRSLVLPDDLAAFDAAHESASPGCPPTQAEYRIRRPDGTVRWLHEWSSTRFDDAGRPVARAGIVQDITEQKLTHQQLAESLALSRIASRLVRLGGWTIDLPDRTLTWSDENCAIHEVPPGYRPTLEEGLALFPPEHREEVVRLVQRCATDGTPYEFEVPKRTTKGRLIWVRSIGEAVRDASGRIVRLQGAFQDVTQLKEAERAVRESNERSALLSLASRDATWDWNIEQGRYWWDANFEAMCGQPPGAGDDEQAWAHHVHPEDRDRVLRRMEDAGRGTADTWSESYRLRPGRGAVAQVIGRAYVLRDAQGQATRMVGSVTDVTERLALEEQLRQAQRLESVGQLTGGVAHDFNNLLTVILGNAEILSEELADQPPLQALGQMVVDAAARGADLTQRLLAFARKQPLAPEGVDLNVRVAGMVPILRRTLGKHVEIDVSKGHDLWPALVDPIQLDNTLLNLCLNARDAMPQGGRLAINTMNLHRVDGDAPRDAGLVSGDYVVLTVSDTGCGIEPGHLARVFEPFFTTKEKAKGTGLGLPIVYGFAKQSGGHVKIESVVGHGTTVRLYLPRAAQVQPQAIPHRDTQQATGPQSDGQSILVVDDEDMVRQYACTQLSALGYTVLQARDAMHALAILDRGEAVDLLFTDVIMPGMGGRELAGQACRRRPGLRVLYTSGYSEEEPAHPDAPQRGCRLLAKPYRREELAGAIRSALAA